MVEVKRAFNFEGKDYQPGDTLAVSNSVARGLELGGESAKAKVIAGGRADCACTRISIAVASLGPVPTPRIIEIPVLVFRPWPKLLPDGTLESEKEDRSEVFVRVRVLRETEGLRELLDPRPLPGLVGLECFLNWPAIRRLGYVIEGEPETREAPAVMVFRPQIPPQ